MSSVAKAEQLYAQAEKKMAKFDWFGMNKEKNMEDAAELFAKAAAQFKIAKEFMRAGESYEKAAECNKGASNEIESNTNYREAGKCFRHVDMNKSVQAYRNCVEHYLGSDRFQQAAKLEEEIGDMFAEDEKYKEAMECYEKSADYFRAENDQASANKRLLKVAMMAGSSGMYDKAIQIFEEVARFNADSNLLRWSVKGYLFNAVLCRFVRETEQGHPKWKNVEDNFEKYCGQNDLFASSREAKLLQKLIPAIQNLELQNFIDEIASHDEISKLDAWSNRLLLKVRRYIEEKQTAAPTFEEDQGNNDDNNDENENIPHATAANVNTTMASAANDIDAPDLL